VPDISDGAWLFDDRLVRDSAEPRVGDGGNGRVYEGRGSSGGIVPNDFGFGVWSWS